MTGVSRAPRHPCRDRALTEAGEAMTTLSGEFLTKNLEGPGKNANQRDKEMPHRTRCKARSEAYFFDATRPKCAKAFGKNCLVGVASPS